MERVFWNVLDINRQRFLKLAKIQDIEFDPMVNIYREIEDHKAQRSGKYTVGNKRDDGSHDNTLTKDDTDIEKFNDGEIAVGIDATGTTRSRGLEKAKDIVDVDHLNKYSLDDDTENGGISKLRDNTRINGKTTTTAGDESTITNNGTVNGETIKADSKAKTDTRVRNADKAAPMSAVNIPMDAGDGDARIAGTNIGNLDFTYASAYGQQNTEGQDSSNDNKDTQGAEDNTSNSGTHSGSDTAEQTNETETGRDVEQRNVGHNKADGEEDASKKAEQTGETEAETTNEDVAGKRADQRQHTGDRTLTRDDTAHDTGTSHTEGHSDESVQEGMAYKGHVQLTGRAMLTPQQAMRDAERYLRDIGSAISWLIGILEPCFIGVFDI